jgi:hypothetical protein
MERGNAAYLRVPMERLSTTDEYLPAFEPVTKKYINATNNSLKFLDYIIIIFFMILLLL